MPFSLFPSRKNDEQVEQLRREFTQQIQIMQQALIEEIRQLPKSIELERQRQVNLLYSPMSHIPDAMKQLQEQIEDLSTKVSQLLPIPIDKGKLDELHASYIQKTQATLSTIADYDATCQMTQQAFDEAQEKRYKEQENLHFSATRIFLRDDKQTDSLLAISKENEPPMLESQ